MGRIQKFSRKNFFIFVFFLAAAPLYFAGCAGQDADKAVSQKAMYRCPMHPTYTSDRPGDCPICGMKLVKMEKSPEPVREAPAQAPEKSPEDVCIEHDCTMKDCAMRVKATLKPGERIACPICGEAISTATGKVVVLAPGAKQPAEKEKSAVNTVMISAEKQQLIGVKTEPVRKMELAKIIRASGKIAYDPQLMVAQEEFIQAVRNEGNVKDSPLKDVSDRAGSLTDAARRKLKLLGMSDEQIAELQNTRKADTSLYLPAKGESVWAYAAIYEYEVGLVRPGAGADIEAAAYPGEAFHGEVVSINPVLDPATRTNQVRIRIPNPNDKLKPEMFVNVKINVRLGEKLAVPENAVLDTGLRKIVYLSREGDILESREVRLGQQAEGYYEVLDGLEENDIVVTSGNFLVDSETRLKSAMTGPSEDGHKHGQ